MLAGDVTGTAGRTAYQGVPTGESAAAAVLRRLADATNRHHLDDVVACFAPHVLSEAPAHPDRSFRGADQIRRNWSQILGGVPDLQAHLVRSAIVDDLAWAEWDWHGTRRDGAPFAMRGVTILQVQADQAHLVRFYMEPVQADGEGVASAVREVVTGPLADGPAQ